MPSQYEIELARDVGECKAGIKALIDRFDEMRERTNEHEHWISTARQRWARLSGVTGLIAFVGSMTPALVFKFLPMISNGR